MDDVNVPAFGLLSARHDTDWISDIVIVSVRYSTDWIAAIVGVSVKYVRELYGGRTLEPRYVVTDFSYAFIYASLQAFNRKSQICYGVRQNRCHRKETRAQTSMSVLVTYQRHWRS